MTVLVAYASAHGSTRSIAERIAAQLTEHGSYAVAASVDEVDNVGPYSAVLVGSAIHNQAWLPKATWFLTDHADELARRPVWLFSVGMPAAVARPLRRLALREEEVLRRDLAGVVEMQEHRLFSGVVSREVFPPGSNQMLFRLTGCRYGDFRDWPAIDRWAASIADDLGRRTPRSDATDAEPR
jgi:menaquinone-dependent protoporphyrinogen oxidase